VFNIKNSIGKPGEPALCSVRAPRDCTHMGASISGPSSPPSLVGFEQAAPNRVSSSELPEKTLEPESSTRENSSSIAAQLEQSTAQELNRPKQEYEEELADLNQNHERRVAQLLEQQAKLREEMELARRQAIAQLSSETAEMRLEHASSVAKLHDEYKKKISDLTVSLRDAATTIAKLKADAEQTRQEPQQDKALGLLNERYASQLAELREKLEEASVQRAALAEDNEEKAQTIAKLTQDCEENRRLVDQITQDSEQKAQLIEQLSDECEQKAKTIEQLTLSHEEKSKTIADLTQELTALKLSHEEQERASAHQDSSAELSKWMKLAEDRQQEITSLTERADKLESDRREVIMSLNETSTQLTDTNKEYQQLLHKNIQRDSEFLSLQDKMGHLQTLRDEIDAHKRRISELEGFAAAAQAETEKLRVQNRHLEQAISHHMTKLHEARESEQKHAQLAEELKAELDSIRSLEATSEIVSATQTPVLMRRKTGAPTGTADLVPVPGALGRSNSISTNSAMNILALAQQKTSQGLHPPDKPNVARRFSEAPSSSPATSPRGKPIIGAPLHLLPSEQLDDYVSPIPSLLLSLRRKLNELDGISKVGIFRIPANDISIAAAKDQISRGDYDQIEDPNVTANLISEFFRCLPFPVLGAIDSQSITAADSPDHAWKTVNSKVVEPSLTLFIWLLDLALDVTYQSDINKMTKKNMAIVLAPNLFLMPKVQLGMSAEEAQKAVAMVKNAANFVEKCLMYREYSRPR